MTLTALLEQLVAIDSINPDVAPGGAGEGEIARFVAVWLERAGLQVDVREVAPDRPNVTAVAPGTGGGRSLLLNAHMDTVGVAGMERPHDPRVEGRRLYGRGAYDMKGGLAAIMHVGAAAAAGRLAGDVIVAAVVDEEYASIGTERLVECTRADAAVVTEPTELRLCLAHKGFVALELETIGRAAHGSRPDLGIDAIAKMGRVLVGLEELDGTLRAGARHELLGTGSLHASMIEGGQEFSSYPARCLLSAERRTVPGETPELVEAQVQRVVDRAAEHDGDLHATVSRVFSREPLEIRRDEPIVETLRRHAGDPEVIGEPYWTDAGLLAGAGIPTVVFGPGGEGAHAVVEWADLDQVERCAEILLATARDFCA